MILWLSQGPTKVALNFKTQFSKPIKQFRQSDLAMEDIKYNFRGLKPSSRKEMLEKLWRIPSKVGSNLIYITLTASEEGRFKTLSESVLNVQSVEGTCTACEVADH